MLIVAWGNAGNAPGKKTDQLALAVGQSQIQVNLAFGQGEVIAIKESGQQRFT